MLDTVAVATSDPDREQPWADLGLKEDEYLRIREILGRRPTSAELAGRMRGGPKSAVRLRPTRRSAPADA